MAQTFTDYYDILKVPRSASQEEVKQAFRRLAREHHPDLHPEKEKDLHTGRMQEINEAYSVLGSKENRAKYDQFGETWKEGAQPPPPASSEGARSDSPGGQGPQGFSDFFRRMFQQDERDSAGERLFSSEADIEAVLDLPLQEAVHGVEKSFSLMTSGICPTCRGTGRAKGAFCSVCGGVGEIRRPREVKSRIPAGLTENSRIRLKGQGNEGPNGRGDLYLRIHLLPDPRFAVSGINLETEIRAMPWQAALGAEISAPTLDGDLRIRIPKGTHTGKKLRLAGHGLGKPGQRGDLFIRVLIDIPDVLSIKAEALLKQLQEETHEQTL